MDFFYNDHGLRTSSQLAKSTRDFSPQEIPSKMHVFEGRRIRSPDGAIYLVLHQKARHIANMGVYNNMFDNWDWSEKSQDVVDAMPKGPQLNAEQPIVAPPQGAPVCIVDEGKIRGIPNPETFNKYGFGWNKIVKKDLGGYPVGAQL